MHIVKIVNHFLRVLSVSVLYLSIPVTYMARHVACLLQMIKQTRGGVLAYSRSHGYKVMSQ